MTSIAGTANVRVFIPYRSYKSKNLQQISLPNNVTAPF